MEPSVAGNFYPSMGKQFIVITRAASFSGLQICKSLVLLYLKPLLFSYLQFTTKCMKCFIFSEQVRQFSIIVPMKFSNWCWKKFIKGNFNFYCKNFYYTILYKNIHGVTRFPKYCLWCVQLALMFICSGNTSCHQSLQCDQSTLMYRNISHYNVICVH